MLLRDLIEVNQKGILRSSVNFSMLDDPEVNRELCEGFIFNYNPQQPKASTAGILNELRHSYHSSTSPNIHLMIQGYGKGKSHFAIALANYFAQPGNSPEVEGILHQVESAVADRNAGLVEGLRAYRDRQHLVICVSGDRGGDLRKNFLQATLHALKQAGVPEAAAVNLCEPPQRYLDSLSSEQVARANTWLAENNAPGGDIDGLIELLRAADTSAIRTIRDLSRLFNNGFPIDFQDSIDIEKILTDLINTLCRGDDPRFQGLLILFDELNYYLQTWIADEEAAGGTALQNITNVCKNNPSKIALLCFTQIDPGKRKDINATAGDRYGKITSRLQDCKYEPVSSLELVLDSLIRAKPEPWQTFQQTWGDTLCAEARSAYESHLRIYRERGWSFEKFHEHLARGCFPLHPIAAGLLANLSLTPDRSVIQFLGDRLVPFLEEDIEINGKLNYFYPVKLVDAFIKIPDDSIHYRSFAQLANADNPDELTVAKALFLYHHSEGKLAKKDTQNHQEILAALTGLSRSRLEAALKSLEENRQIIYYQKATRTYAFFEGINPNELEKAIAEEFNELAPQLNPDELFNDLVKYCQGRVSQYLKNHRLAAEPFISERQLAYDDWQFERRFYSISDFLLKLQSDTELKSLESRGLLAYVLAADLAELQDLRHSIDAKLAHSPLKDRLVVAIPTEEVGPLGELRRKIQLLEKKDTGDRHLWGEAYQQLLKRWRGELDTTLQRLVQPENCTHHCRVHAKVPPQEQHNPARYISALLADLYPFVPPVGGMSQMGSGHNTGSKVTGFMARQLFAGELPTHSLPDRSYQTILDQVFCSTWRIFHKTTDRYRFQEPQHETVRAAWEELSRLADLNGEEERTIPLAKLWERLSSPPYGYNEYTFTVLLAAWLAERRREVALKGPPKIKFRRGEKVTIVTQALPAWAKTDILNKPFDFVHTWILAHKASLIRRQRPVLPPPPEFPASFPKAEAYHDALNRFLALDPGETEPSERLEAEAHRDAIATKLEEIRQWFQPIEEAEALPDPAPLADLLAVYPTLHAKPPAIEMRSEVISVRPSPEQRDRQTTAQTKILSRIRASIDQLSERSDSLPDLEACGAYLEELRVAIEQVTATADLPDDLATSLNYAQQVAQRRRQDLHQAEQIEQYLAQIREAAQLPNYFTQQDYAAACQRIEPLRAKIPADNPAASEVQKIRQDLDLNYRELCEKVDAWESQAESTASKEQALELIKTINAQRRRYTEPSYGDRLQQLQAKLDRTIMNPSDGDRAPEPPPPSIDPCSEVLNIAQQKIQRIRDLPFGKLPEIFRVYQELAELSLPEMGSADLAHTCGQKLQGKQTEGRSCLAQRFEQICDRAVSHLADCEAQQQRLESARTLVTEDGFPDLRDQLDRALATLQDRRADLERLERDRQLQAADKQTMQAIRAYKASKKLDTLQLCEEALTEIEASRAKLHNPDTYQKEIAAIQQDIQAKIASYQQQLQALGDRLASATTPEALDQLRLDYNRHNYLFRDSSQLEAYQALGDPIRHRLADLKTLADLATRSHQGRSILQCQELLGLLEQVPLHDRDRCQANLDEIRQQLAAKQQHFEQALIQLEQQLTEVSNTHSAKKLQRQLLPQENVYKDSPLAERFQTLSTDAERVLDLYQLLDSLAPTTLDKARELRDRLARWRNNLPDCSPDLDDIYTAKLEAIDATYQQLYEQKRQAAAAWVKNIGQEAAKIYRTSDDKERLAIATALSKTIRQEQKQHQDFLTEELKGTIARVIALCGEEIEKDKVNQIRTLFQQLPRVQREDLYQELKQYLGKKTEVSDG